MLLPALIGAGQSDATQEQAEEEPGTEETPAEGDAEVEESAHTSG